MTTYNLTHRNGSTSFKPFVDHAAAMAYKIANSLLSVKPRC